MRQSQSSSPSLRRARALVVGVGGLGCPGRAWRWRRPASGRSGSSIPTVVEVSNLHRQPLYDDADLGRPKVDGRRRPAAGGRLGAARRDVRGPASTPTLAPLLDDFDVVLDGTDSIAAKFAVNDAAVAARVPLVHAGALGTRAQLMTVLPGAHRLLPLRLRGSAAARRRALLPGGWRPRPGRSCSRARCRPPTPSALLAGVPPLFADRPAHDRHLARQLAPHRRDRRRPSCPTLRHLASEPQRRKGV